MRASASIPGVFPPVYIQSRAANGQVYDEMHVDGGTSAQVFLYPPEVDWEAFVRLLNVPNRPKAYLIRNSEQESLYQKVEP